MDRCKRKPQAARCCAAAGIILAALLAGGCGAVFGEETPPIAHMDQMAILVPSETDPTTVPTAAPETEPETTAPPQTEATEEPENTQVLKILSYPETVSPRQEAVVAIQGKPYTEYRITVRYKSGPSQAAGLEPKITDAEGNVSWTWRIGSRTSQGTYPIEIAGCGEKETVHFTVTG